MLTIFERTWSLAESRPGPSAISAKGCGAPHSQSGYAVGVSLRPLQLCLIASLALASLAKAEIHVRAEGRVIQDSNVFLQDEAAPLAVGQTVRTAPAGADDQEFVALLGFTARHAPSASGGRFSGEIDYAAEWHRFARFIDESHLDHRVNLAAKGTVGEWLAEAKACVLHIDGSDQSPIYNEEGGQPAMAADPVRSRRAQTLTTGAASLVWPAGPTWRARATATLLNQDFHTLHDPVFGCANYVDRGQAIGGIEIGRAFRPEVSGWFAFRAGRQWQENLFGLPMNFSNTIVRPLFGVEGKLHPTLRLSAFAGPDFRRFTNERLAGTPERRTLPFVEVAAAWTPRKSDSVTANYRQQLWLGSSSRSAYREIKADLAWTHRFDAFELTTRATVLSGDFGGYSPAPRDDRVWTLGASVARTFAGFRGELGLTRECGETFVPETRGRAYHRWLATAALSHKW